MAELSVSSPPLRPKTKLKASRFDRFRVRLLSWFISNGLIILSYDQIYLSVKFQYKVMALN